MNIFQKVLNCNNKLFVIGDKDLPESMDHDAAVLACMNMGRGWRLPTVDELKAMKEQLFLKNIGGLASNRLYWSNEKKDSWNGWLFKMEDKWQYDSLIFHKFWVRPVKDLSKV